MTRKPVDRAALASLQSLGSLSPAERDFIQQAEAIAAEVAAMSDEEVADYIVDNNLQALVAPDRIEAIIADAFRNAGGDKPFV